MESASGCGRLRSPPWKLLSGQLRLAVSRSGRTGPWLLEREGSGRAPLEVSVVWMQGTVQEVRPEGNISLRLQDPSGSFTVTGAGGVPKGRPCLATGITLAGCQSSGKYVMVMGVVQSCSPEPVVRAVKLTDLSGNALHRSMWSLEVEDLQQNIP
ncbi:recQ-mediated genome instability protein 2 isoform X1 [Carcharodon carcharias]|uniref:recQ-mediated genome instability protein 2 isoform X1 n=1 Tax=Carcharodon carcharias TaxID=13397 RepID=UPI001B7E044D|nr:recQ-mediated genome instability protein 2 isoform X1 [Carcharodon carcharias]